MIDFNPLNLHLLIQYQLFLPFQDLLFFER